MNDKLSLEEAMNKLNDLTVQLEDSDLSLEKAFSLYSEGVKLVKFCNEQLQGVEKDIIILNEDIENE